MPGTTRAGPKNIRAGAEASLKRLGVDRIDLYYAHADDLDTPIDETLREFDALVREGKVRYIAASNFTAARLSAALATSAREGLARYVALQPHYNLMVRNEYEGALSDVCAREGVACVPYFALAMGFLTGKYRPGATVESARAEGARRYLDARGSECSPRSTTSPPRTRRPLLLSPSHGCSPSRPLPRQLRAREPSPNSRTCCRMATTMLTAEESTRLADTSRV